MTFHIDQIDNNISQSYHNTYDILKSKYGILSGSASTQDIEKYFIYFEKLGYKSSQHPFIKKLSYMSFSKEGFIYFSKAFYTHIYYAFEDVMFKICINAPPYIDLRLEIIRNLWDEFGQGKTKNIHLRLYENSLLSFLNIQPILNSDLHNFNDDKYTIFMKKYGVDKQVVDSSVQWSMLGDLPYKAALGAIVIGSELTPKVLFPPIINAIKKLGYGNDVYKFFSLHTIVDEEHYINLKRILVSYIKTKEDILNIEIGLRLMLNIRNNFFSHLNNRNILV